MAEKAPAFQFYPKDFLVDEHVALMSLQEVGAYVILLCHAWLEGGIPPDCDRLARLCRVSTPAFSRLWPSLEPLFQPQGANGRLINRRMEEERAKQQSYKQAQADSGRVGANIRWGRHSRPNGVAINSPMAKNSSSSPTPTAVTTPLPPFFSDSEDFGQSDSMGGLPGFDDFRRGYDQTGKPLSEDDWMRAALIWVNSDLERIAKEVTAELRHELINGWQDLVKNKQHKLIPNPATWLKRQPWRNRLVAV